MDSFPEILYEDNHIVAVNKGNSDLVQKDITGDVSLDQKIRTYIGKKYNKPGNVFLGITHRLDRPVSGIVLFARTSKALSRLNKMFHDGEIQKEYWAIVKNKPRKDEETLVDYMVKNARQNKSYCHEKEVPGSKLARLTYHLIGRSEKYYLLSIELHTGRHHQIRSQLSNIGCPIKGDLKYGYPRSNEDGGISLHARRIKFIHPVKKELVEITADPPASELLWDKFSIG